MFTSRERRGATPAVEREVRGACGGGGGPAWNETPRDLRPACSAPAPHAPLPSEIEDTEAALPTREREPAIRIALRGVALRNASVRAMREVDMQ